MKVGDKSYTNLTNYINSNYNDLDIKEYLFNIKNVQKILKCNQDEATALYNLDDIQLNQILSKNNTNIDVFIRKLAIGAYNYVTYNEILISLSTYKRFLLIRPTGFGKTYTSAGLALDELRNTNNKVTFIFATKVVREQFYRYVKQFSNNDKSILERINYISYTDLSNSDKWSNKHYIEDAFEGVGLVIFDEAHLMCGDKREKSIKEIFNTLKDIKIFGCTATTERTDRKDVVTTFFTSANGNNSISHTSRYVIDVQKCYKLGILTEPIYLTFDISSELINTNKEFKDLTSLEAQLSSVLNISDFINESLKIRYTNIGEIKELTFIVFLTGKGLRNDLAKGKINSAFVSCGYAVKEYEVTSKSLGGYDIQSKLNDIYNDKSLNNEKVAKLIYSIDLLTLGMHVEGLDGVIMLRQTSSAIIYNQQVGRCLSASSYDRKIVLDLVANLNNDEILARLLYNAVKYSGLNTTKKTIAKKCKDADGNDITIYKFNPEIKQAVISDIAQRLIANGGKGAKIAAVKEILDTYENKRVSLDNAIAYVYALAEQRRYRGAKLISRLNVDSLIKYALTPSGSWVIFKIRETDTDLLKKVTSSNVKYKLIKG